MRIAATAATLLFALASCSTSDTAKVSPYLQPNELMSSEINSRIQQIPYQHRGELLNNLLWLSQAGEQTIPALLEGLRHDSPKVRSSCCWVLGRLRDRRTVKNLQALVHDEEPSVRLEAARSLVLMGDLDQAPHLIAGLDSDRKEVRYMCHEALKTSTGHDFGYDHLESDQRDLRMAVLRWRQWWGEYSGDTYFAQSYEQEHGLGAYAAPAGETQAVEPDGSGENHGDAPGGAMPGQDEPGQASPTNQPEPEGEPELPLTPATVPNSTVPNGATPNGAVPNSTAANAGEPDVGTPVEVVESVGSETTEASPDPVVELPVVEVEGSEHPAQTSEPQVEPAPVPAGGQAPGSSGNGHH